MCARRILIADDDVDDLRLVGMMLERQGYEILAATNGQQALRKAVEGQPALIILDVMMPEMDGYEVAAKLRNHPATESIPILMFTAKTAVNDRIAGFQAGADDYVTKPVHPRELTRRVESLLERRAHEASGMETSHLIGFLPTKGGIGTSTLALNTAVELRRMHGNQKSILIELQEGGGTLAMQLGLEETLDHGRRLSGLIKAPLFHITQERLRDFVVRHESGVQALLATSRLAGIGPQLQPSHVRTILRYLSADYDYLLLDLPSNLYAACREALSVCRLIIVTVEPNPIGMRLAQMTFNALDEVGIGSQKARVVLIHRVPALGTLSRNMVEQSLHREMIAGIPPAADLAYESISNGRPMVEIQPQSLVAQQVRRVVQSIVEG